MTPWYVSGEYGISIDKLFSKENLAFNAGFVATIGDVYIATIRIILINNGGLPPLRGMK